MLLDELPKKCYKPGEKIPLTKGMVKFLGELWARSHNLKIISITCTDQDGNTETITY